MKLYQTSDSSVLRLYFPFMGVLVLLCFVAFAQFANMVLVHWLFLLLLVVLLLSPARSQRYGERSYSWLQLIFAIIGTSALLLMLFYFGSIFFTQLLPVDVPTDITPLSSAFLLTQGGLCPWAIVALLAITLQKVCLEDHKSGLISSCLQNLFHTDEHQDVGKFINLYFRHVILFALIMPMILCCFAILHLTVRYFNLHLSLGINLINLAATTYIFWIITYTRWARGLNFLLDYHVPKLAGIMIMMLGMMILLSGIAIIANTILITMQMPLMQFHYFSTAAWPIIWKSYHVFLAFSWVPIMSAIVAIVSRGYAVWQIILITLIAPLVSVFLTPSQVPTLFTHYFWLTDLLLVAVAIALLLTLLREKYLTNLLRATLPFPHEIKQRNTAMYARSILISAITMICIYWVLGIYGVNFILTIATTPVIILIMLSICSSLLHWRRVLFCAKF